MTTPYKKPYTIRRLFYGTRWQDIPFEGRYQSLENAIRRARHFVGRGIHGVYDANRGEIVWRSDEHGHTLPRGSDDTRE